MNKRGRRTVAELKDVSTADMTPAEYARSDTPGTFVVHATDGAQYRVSGMHSARAVQKIVGGTIKKGR